MSEDDEELLTTMLDALSRIARYIGGREEVEILDDQMTLDAVALNLLVTGECGRRLSPEMRVDLPAPWPQIIALRHRIAHGYGSLDPLRLLDTAVEHAPRLRKQVADALEHR